MNEDLKGMLLLFIGKFVRERGFSPSIRDIMTAIDIDSTSYTRFLLDGLVEEDLVTYVPTLARTARLTKKGEKIVFPN